MISLAELSALAQVVVVDLVLAGDNAIIVGLVATTQLLQIIGLTLAGGLLLLWVCWKLWREIRSQTHSPAQDEPEGAKLKPVKTFRQAVTQIVLADISMSLDNVLAVAGIALHHTWVLVAGLVLSVTLMGAAAAMIAG